MSKLIDPQTDSQLTHISQIVNGVLADLGLEPPPFITMVNYSTQEEVKSDDIP